MLNNIRVQSIDFVQAIYRLVEMHDYRKEIHKMGAEPSPETEQLVEEMSKSVSMRVFEDLKSICKKYYLNVLFTAYALKNPSFSPLEIIDLIKSLGPEGLYDAYVREVVKPLEPGEHAIKARIDEVLENNTKQVIMNYAQLKRFKTESLEVFPILIETLVQFEGVYSKISPRIEAIYQREILKFEADMTDEARFRTSFLMIQFDGETDSLKKIDVCVTVLGEYTLMYNISQDHSSMKMIVGFGMRDFTLNQEKTFAQEVFKTLGDPTKLVMIQMASKEPVCAKDLASRLSLSKATISHHICILIGLKIFTLNLQEGKKMYYKTNQEMLKRIFDNFLNELNQSE